MELPYQTLKNLSEKKLKGRAVASRLSIEALDRAIVEFAGDVLSEASELADMAGKKRISEAHIERAIAIIYKRR